jgi:hypothetical protein
MANSRDIAGLLTGIPSGGIDPRVGMTGREMLTQSALAGQQRMASGLRGMLGGGPTIQEQLVQAQGQKMRADEQKRLTQRERLADALPPEYSSLAYAVRNNVEGSIPKSLEVLGRKKETTPTTKPDIVNLVDTKTNTTVGTAIEKDGRLFKMDGTTPISPEELKDFGISTSYVTPPKSLVSTVADPKAKAEAERLSQMFVPLTKVAESTAETATTASLEKKNATNTLAAMEYNAATGVISAVSSDLAQIGQDVFQNLGIAVPEGWSKLTSSKAQYQMISAQGLLPRIAEQGRGFTDTEREYFLKEVIPSYKQAWQFNELAANLQLEGAVTKIAEAGFADSRNIWHVESNTTPKQAHAVVWDDYLTKLPYNKLKQDAKRTVGDKEVTYDRYNALTDDSKLWQYWSTGKEPTGFTLKQDDGTTKDYTFKELDNLFKGYSAREVLQRADETSNLVGATY